MERILSEIRQLAQALPPDALDRAIAKIDAHDRIFFTAAGRSGLMLRALAMRLAQMGRCAYVAGETITPAIGEGDLLVAASASGRTPSVCRHVQTAQACGADVLVITAAEDAPLTKLQPPEVVFRAPSKESASGGQPMGSLFEQALLIFGDALVSRMDADAESMRMRHANLE